MSATVSRYSAASVRRVADEAGEIGDHADVGEILLLRDVAHRQVMAHEELDELGIGLPRRRGRGRSGAPRRRRARSVAAAALGDIVEQRGDVEQPRLVEARASAGAARVLVRVLGDEEAPHVAQHHEDVLVTV
jgi:hypothetical protein